MWELTRAQVIIMGMMGITPIIMIPTIMGPIMDPGIIMDPATILITEDINIGMAMEDIMAPDATTTTTGMVSAISIK